MATHIFHQEKDVFYFCTLTCFKWINLFEITQFYDGIYNWFGILHENHCWLSSYVIMPNHLHIIIYVSDQSRSLNTLFANGKRFMAYEIVERLRSAGESSLLHFLEKTVSYSESRKNDRHKIFIPSFDAKLCDTIEMIEQKLDYIHYNPVNRNWNLANSYLEYPYSSAAYYENGAPINFTWFKDYRDILYE